MLRAPTMPAAASRRCSFAAGSVVLPAARAPLCGASRSALFPLVAELDRLRLHNLSPEDGSRKNKTRVGRGHSAGQVSQQRPSSS